MKAETEETVRWRRAWRSLSLDAVPQAGCPEPDRLWEAVRGGLGPGEVREMVEHTAVCGACAEAWRLARELGRRAGAENAGERPAAAARASARQVPAARRWRVATWGSAVAAAALLAVVGLEWRDSFAPRPTVIYRGAETAAIRSLVPPGEALPRRDFTLRWEGPEGARYRLRVTTEDLTVVAEASDLGTPEYRVAEEDLAAVADGSRLYFKVTARLSGGGTAESATFEVRLE